MHVREAREEDLDTIYMMGYDVWGDDSPESDYIKECKKSVKYSSGKWYVLENNDRVLLSSLLIHDLNKYNCDTKLEIKGIGSIATPFNLRKQGYASKLVEKIMSFLSEETSKDIWFLYSDIGVEFYNRLKFEELPIKFQKYSSTTLMAYSKDDVWNMDNNNPKIKIPKYF